MPSSKLGDGYLRHLLVTGAHAVLLRSKPARLNPWLIGLLRRRPRMVVAVAAANKMARITWAIMSRNDSYRSVAAAASSGGRQELARVMKRDGKTRQSMDRQKPGQLSVPTY